MGGRKRMDHQEEIGMDADRFDRLARTLARGVSRRRALTWLGGTLGAAALATLGRDGPGPAAAHTVAGAPAAAMGTPAAPGPSSLQWQPCADVPDAECAWLTVPVDPAQPAGARLR